MKKLTNGKSQFNATSAKKFRETMAKWGNAQFDIAEEILRKSDRVKAHKIIIDSNNDRIAKIKDGKPVIGNATIESIEAENKKLMEDIAKENENLAEFKKAQDDRLKLGADLVTDALYKAYTTSIKDDADDALYDAIADFLTANGVEPRHTTVYTLVRKSGGDKVNSARNKVKTGMQNGVQSKSVWTKIFLGAMYDTMGDAIPKYKFTYVLKDKRKDAVKHTETTLNNKSLPSDAKENAPVVATVDAK